MALTSDNVRKIASLARLRLTAEEENLFAGQLGAIVDYIDQLRQYASGSPERPGGALSEPGGHEADDRVRPCLPREEFLANAPAALEGFLLVPEIKGRDDGE